MSRDIMADIAATAERVRAMPGFLRTQSSVARALRDSSVKGSPMTYHAGSGRVTMKKNSKTSGR